MTTRKVRSVVLLMSFILSFSIFAPMAAAQGEGYVSVSSTYDNGSGITELTIEAQDLDDLYAGQFDLNYNPDFGYVRSVSKGEMIEGAQVSINTDQARDGKISVAFAAESTLSSSGELLTIEFYAAPSQGVESTELTITNTAFINSSFEQVQPVVTDGFIKPFEGVEKEEQQVAADKEWTVAFSTTMKEASVNDSTVYIVNTRGDKVEADLTLSSDKKEVTIVPSEAFNSRYNYEVIVTEKLLSESGKALKQAVKLPFSIQ